MPDELCVTDGAVESSDKSTSYCLFWHVFNGLYLFGYLTDQISFCLYNLVHWLPVMYIIFWFNIYLKIKTVFFLLYFLERFSGVEEDFIFNYISPNGHKTIFVRIII